jgi:hypothetical protein
MKGLIDHYIVSMLEVEEEIRQDLEHDDAIEAGYTKDFNLEEMLQYYEFSGAYKVMLEIT